MEKLNNYEKTTKEKIDGEYKEIFRILDKKIKERLEKEGGNKKS